MILGNVHGGGGGVNHISFPGKRTTNSRNEQVSSQTNTHDLTFGEGVLWGVENMPRKKKYRKPFQSMKNYSSEGTVSC